MPGRSATKVRCAKCALREVLCLCSIAPRLELKTRVTILMHWREVPTTTNTARLATLVLPNSEIRIRGDRSKPLKTDDLVMPGIKSLLLFPSDDSIELTPDFLRRHSESKGDGPFHLLVPDGSWRQARKVATREAALSSIPRVRLPSGERSSYRLRHSPFKENLSTFEGIARALGVIEGTAVQTQLEAIFDIMIERVLWGRGSIKTSECRNPVPQEAIDAFHIDGSASQERYLAKLAKLTVQSDEAAPHP